jgi:hypothetical protein
MEQPREWNPGELEMELASGKTTERDDFRHRGKAVQRRKEVSSIWPEWRRHETEVLRQTSQHAFAHVRLRKPVAVACYGEE